MTQPDRTGQSEQTAQEDRAARIQRLVNEGREAELDEQDDRFAIENGLIEG
ncbi:hypothetical protein DAERI_020399 [Deinococcus aerius]|uniref:Uncharacterized protein n=2 Tax=Deinococcus TaxID=1298 RepID=A0A2I9CSW1_9DEIO|nr:MULTISPECIES: hypothetical protein [Deinococcus]MBB5293749.1 hypothetical protein [Deinococcus metallilatus]GBF04802.1 hypothetical protein DAERI_020399 [Deinococcus aerius]GMA17678.1 hypothetical protein GCM10025871_40090 [Deinococcus metallilatus]